MLIFITPKEAGGRKSCSCDCRYLLDAPSKQPPRSYGASPSGHSRNAVEGSNIIPENQVVIYYSEVGGRGRGTRRFQQEHNPHLCNKLPRHR